MGFPRASSAIAFSAAALIVACTLTAFTAHPASQATQGSYTLYTTEGRRVVAFRVVNGVDFVALDHLTSTFGLMVVEDALVNGITVRGRGQPILLIPGQSFVSIGPGRIVSLPGAIQRDRGDWIVPMDFIRQALGPALGLRVEVRRATRVILVGDVRLPQISGRFERLPAGARLTFEIQPAAPQRTTREGRRLLIRFDAAALDLAAIPGLAPEFVSGVRVDGSTLVVDFGASTASYRAGMPDENHLFIELLAPGAPMPAPPRAPTQAAPPVVDTAPSTGLRTIVLDPGHGGEDGGAVGTGGTKEKDLTLQIAQRTKAAIESRIGLRVLLTRTTDDTVPIDQRASLANNNKADLFISLHANASVRPDIHGAHVLSLDVSNYSRQAEASAPKELPVPVAGGGTRAVDMVPWDLAQLPFADKSAAVAGALVRHLADRRVPLYGASTARLPLRPLVGAHMPAVLLELGFLTNRGDESALNGAEVSSAIVEAIVDTIAEIRRGMPAGARAP